MGVDYEAVLWASDELWPDGAAVSGDSTAAWGAVFTGACGVIIAGVEISRESELVHFHDSVRVSHRGFLLAAVFALGKSYCSAGHNHGNGGVVVCNRHLQAILVCEYAALCAVWHAVCFA